MSIATTETVSNNPTGSIWTKSFWKGAGERAIKTFAQSVLSTFGVLEGLSAVSADALTGATTLGTWQVALIAAAVAALLSLFSSIANPQFVAGVHAVEVVRDVVPAPTDGYGAGVAGPSVEDVAADLGSTGGDHADVPSADSLEAEVAAIAARAASSRTGSTTVGGV